MKILTVFLKWVLGSIALAGVGFIAILGINVYGRAQINQEYINEGQSIQAEHDEVIQTRARRIID